MFNLAKKVGLKEKNCYLHSKEVQNVTVPLVNKIPSDYLE